MVFEGQKYTIKRQETTGVKKWICSQCRKVTLKTLDSNVSSLPEII